MSDVIKAIWLMLVLIGDILTILLLCFLIYYILSGDFESDMGMLDYAKKTKEVLAQCEAELPRNQSCKLIAVPIQAVQDRGVGDNTH